MKKILYLIIIILFNKLTYAKNGDTLRVHIHDKTHLKWHESYFDKAKFPSKDKDFRKIIMYFTLGCPDHGCSGWDYTIQTYALKHTGIIDTVIKQQPAFTVNGEIKEKCAYNKQKKFITYFDTVHKKTDSTEVKTFDIILYNNPERPAIKTDSIRVWAANYYNYYFDNQGKKIDSTWIDASDSLNLFYRNYKIYAEKIERYELMRMMTPYSADKTKEWSLTYDFDVTDYAPILHDSVEIELVYSGWQDGFTVSLDFKFIEGIPARKPLEVKNIWQSGLDGFKYGDIKDPIENYTHPYLINLNNNVENAKIRMVPSGHSFGGEEDCAEFCPKHFELSINNKSIAKQLIWKSDCGLNPIYPQTGTWIFKRANWCPGTLAVPHDFEISTYLNKTKTDTLKILFDPYTYTKGAGTHPMYIFESQLFTYGKPAFKNDVSLETILTPNNNPLHSRYDFIAGQAAILIQNMGIDTLKSLDINYGFDKKHYKTSHWKGAIPFMGKDTIILNDLDWNYYKSTFNCVLLNPNNQPDEYPLDNTQKTQVNMLDSYENSFIITTKTNKQPEENQYRIIDSKGKTIFSKDTFEKDTIHNDTIQLPNGLYTFIFEDKGEDGLSFWFNPEAGHGSIKFKNLKGQLLKMFHDDFGIRIVYPFIISNNRIKYYKSDKIEINYCSDEKQLYIFRTKLGKAQYKLFDNKAKELTNGNIKKNENIITVDMKNNPRGLYQIMYIKNKEKQLLRFINR